MTGRVLLRDLPYLSELLYSGFPTAETTYLKQYLYLITPSCRIVCVKLLILDLKPLHWFLRTSVTKYHKLGNLNQQKCILLTVVEAGSSNHGVNRTRLFLSRILPFLSPLPQL